MCENKCLYVKWSALALGFKSGTLPTHICLCSVYESSQNPINNMNIS